MTPNDTTTSLSAQRASKSAGNPLLIESSLDYQLPPFTDIKIEHFAPAFAKAIERHNAEIDSITSNPAPVSWENTIDAFEKSGRDLARVLSVFSNLSGTDVTDEMEKIAAEIYPRLAAHWDAIYQNEALYERIKNAQPSDASLNSPKNKSGDNDEAAHLHAYLLRIFARKGAELDESGKQQLSDINQRLSALSEEFGRNLLADTRRLAVHFDSADELEGLLESRIAAARQEAEQPAAGYIIPLELPTVQSEQARLKKASARKKLYDQAALRGRETNAAILIESVQLRAQRAKLLGYSTHADYVIAEETAREKDAVHSMLSDLAIAASANAAGEHKLLAEQAELAGENFTAADWPYWESKVRERDFNIDEAELRKYFPLDRVLHDGVFEAARRLYGITVEKREDLKGYADGVMVWEVKEEDGSGIGLLLTDYFGRPTKRGGAWMSSFMEQSRLLDTKPVIVNVMGITKPADDSAPLLSLDELRTVFHEFGHALHGLLSDVYYPTFSGTNVPRDWVEFPSQINENWAFDRELIKNYAFHIETGDVIPDELLDAIEDANQFGQGFATAEYLAASIIDLAWHSLTAEQAAKLESSVEAIEEFEKQALESAGLVVDDIAPRYRSTYFNHIFAGGYSAGYYSYLWAEALDADGFEWFKERGAAGAKLSDAALRQAGQHFRDTILSTGASVDFTEAYRAFRGRDKDLKPLLERRNLSGAI